MSVEMHEDTRGCISDDPLLPEDLGSSELKQILIDLLVVKYPGIEQGDIDRLMNALDAGALDRVERIEADMAVKSARWKRAAMDLAP